MTSAATKRRWSFRTRLTALIAAVFITGGAALLGVQYLLVRRLFVTAIGAMTGCVSDSGDVALVSGNHAGLAECSELIETSEVDGQRQITSGQGPEGAGVIVEQTTMLSQEVLSGLLLWSVLTLLIFTLVAVFAASWLSRRSFARISQITDTTRHITREDLHQRLDLPGPTDEIRELGDTIDAMLDGLEASFIQQERFITNASHELRTPLTMTRTALEIPLEQGRVPAHLEPSLRRALDANYRSEKLIAALLRLARNTAVAPESDPQPVELAEIIAGSLAGRRADIESAGLTVVEELADTWVEGVDPMLLTLAIDNLIENAVRHNHEKGTIHITTGAAGGRAWVEISNSGRAVSEEEAETLTQPFNRGKSTRTAGGGGSLGLGLTLVQNIADSLTGTLTLSPRPAGGLIARLQFCAGRAR